MYVEVETVTFAINVGLKPKYNNNDHTVKFPFN